MTSTLEEPGFTALLNRLYTEADASQQRLRDWIATQSAEEIAAWRASVSDYQTLYRNAKDVHMAVPRSTARLLYILTRNRQARTVVEFGTSFGLSTLHLAAAVRDNGGGLVIGSEFEPGKVAQARRNVADAGLGELVEIRDGDALDTLAGDLPTTVDLVFLDGAKQLYLPVVKLLEARLSPGALIVADNADDAEDFLDHVRRSGAYLSTDLGGRVEIALRTVTTAIS